LQIHETEILTTAPRYLHWSGSDVLNVSNEQGVKLKMIVETNSSSLRVDEELRPASLEHPATTNTKATSRT